MIFPSKIKGKNLERFAVLWCNGYDCSISESRFHSERHPFGGKGCWIASYPKEDYIIILHAKCILQYTDAKSNVVSQIGCLHGAISENRGSWGHWISRVIKEIPSYLANS